MEKQLITTCAFLYHGGKILIAKRAATKSFLPNKFELPGGHVEYGETFEQALQRELFEELTVTVEVKVPVYAFTYLNQVKQSHSAEVVFLCTITADSAEPTIHSNDHSELRWVDLAEARQCYDSDDAELVAIEAGFSYISLLPSSALVG